MRRMRFVVVVLVFSLAFVLVAADAFAEPSASAVDEIGSVCALEARGFAGLTPSLTSPGVLGGDAHLQIEVPSVAIEIGGRLGTDASARELSMIDAGVHWFPDETATHALFVGGGAFYGNEWVHGYKLRTASLTGLYGEVGYETPRDKDLRAVASFRVDLGYAAMEAMRAVVDGKLKPGSTELDAGKLGKLQVVNGSEILLGAPYVFDKGNIDKFDF